MSKGQRIADIAKAHADSSSVLHVNVYEDAVRRPADEGAALDGFFLHNAAMSSCALLLLGCWRLAGCTEPECLAPYFPKGGPERDAVVDVGVLARRCHAWTTASMPMPMPKTGDAFMVANDAGGDAHVGIFTSDAVLASSRDVNAPGATFTAQTVEGGQYSGKDSSAIEAFTRTFRCVGNRWMLGDRHLLGFVSAESLPIPDDGDPLPHFDPSDQKSA